MKEKKLTPKEAKKLQIRLQKKELKKNAKSLVDALEKNRKAQKVQSKKGKSLSHTAPSSSSGYSSDYSNEKKKNIFPSNSHSHAFSNGIVTNPSKGSFVKKNRDTSKSKFNRNSSNIQLSSKSSQGKIGLKRKANEISSSPSSSLLNDNDSSNEKQQKREVKKKRKSGKSNFTLVEQVKADWNRIRTKALPLEEKRSIIENMIKKLYGYVVQVSLRHDASRIIQSILQYGRIDQRAKILNELAPKLAELAKTPYGHFTGLKAIVLCTESDEQKKILSGLKTHFVSIGTNVIGARTVETILQSYPLAMTRELKAEFYGHKFTLLLPEVPRSLHSIMEALPSKESAILDHMKDLIQKFIEKGLLNFTYVHNLLWEYIRELTSNKGKAPKLMDDLITSLMESILQLVTTKPGAKSVCILSTYGNAKERKRIIKAIKGHTIELAIHPSSHLALMRIIDVTDDTINIQKSIFDEIRSIQPIEKYTASGDIVSKPLPALVMLAKNVYGSKVLLHIIDRNNKYLQPDEEILFHGVISNTKKNPDMRWKEHITYLKNPLTQVCQKYCEDFIRDKYGYRVLEAFIKLFYPISVIQAIANVYAGYGTDDIEIIDEEEDGNDDDDDDDDHDDHDVDDHHNVDDGNNLNNNDLVDYWAEDNKETNENDSVPINSIDETEDNDDKLTSKDSIQQPLLSIEEDPIAHIFLRSIIQMESQVTSDSTSIKSSDKSIDKSLWDDSYRIEENGFCITLLSHFKENNQLLRQWISCNRACLALADMFKVKSVIPVLCNLLLTEEDLLIQNEKTIKGAKVLYEIYSSSKPNHLEKKSLDKKKSSNK